VRNSVEQFTRRFVGISRICLKRTAAPGELRATRRVNRGSRFQLAILRIADNNPPQPKVGTPKWCARLAINETY